MCDLWLFWTFFWNKFRFIKKKQHRVKVLLFGMKEGFELLHRFDHLLDEGDFVF